MGICEKRISQKHIFSGVFLKIVLEHLWQTASVLSNEKTVKDNSSKIDFIGLVIED